MGGFFGEVARADLAGERKALIFATHPGDVVPPMKTDRGWVIVLVHDRHKIRLEDDPTKFRDTLFTQRIEDTVARAELARGSLG
jgi:parvulin-like peptidyl-prolyl isomerase